jgi:hypothetical protein
MTSSHVTNSYFDSGVRDALLETARADDYRHIYERLLRQSQLLTLPQVVLIQGGFGTGKTRLLKGLAACAEEQELPWTFFNTSQYDPSHVDLTKALMARMGAHYVKVFDSKQRRAQLFGFLAGSGEALASFLEKSPLSFVGTIIGNASRMSKLVKDATDKERLELFGEWTQYGDPVETLRSEFSKMVNDVVEKCGNAHPQNKGAPWLVLIDDADRLFPEAALDLLLQLRSVVNGVFDLSPGPELVLPPPVLFVVAMNAESLRMAIRHRYGTYMTNGAQLSHFVEHYLRKLFLVGPSVPGATKSEIEMAFARRAGDVIPATTLSELASLAADSSLSYRGILRAFDRVFFDVALRKSMKSEVTCALYALECMRFCAEAQMEALANAANPGADVLRKLKENTDFLGEHASAILEAASTKYIHDTQSWRKAWAVFTEAAMVGDKMK